MNAYLPIVPEPSWKQSLSSVGFASLHERVLSQHQQVINEIALNKPLLAIQLSEESFWNNLIAQSQYDRAVQSLHAEWKEISPLAHLNTKELIALLREKIVPLEQNCQHILLILGEREKLERSRWKPKWYKQARTHIQQSISENKKRLALLKQLIYKNLHYRCKVHHILGMSYEVDDALAAFCHRINAFNALPDPLIAPSVLSRQLNADRRLTIYDILRNANQNEALGEITAPIPKRTRLILSSAAEMKAGLQRTNEFCVEVILRLGLSGISAYFPSLAPTALWQAWLSEWIDQDWLNGLRERLRGWGIPGILQGLWALRYGLYLALSLFIYYSIAQIITPLLFVFFSKAVSAFILNGLFYTIGLAPVWYFVWTGLSKIGNTIHEYLVHRKKQEIVQAILTIERTQHFICELSQTIIDITHFDVADITEKVKHYQLQLQDASALLNRFYKGEKIICYGVTYESVIEVKAKMAEQERQIKTCLELLSSHIADNVGEDIGLLGTQIQNGQLMPLLQRGQIQRLRVFIAQWGPDYTGKFEEKANVINRWREDASLEHFCIEENSARSFLQPWGTHTLREDVLKGWERILEAFVDDPEEKHAALTIQAILKGEEDKKITPQTALRFNEAKIQAMLFATLGGKRAHNAYFLSQENKWKVEMWYKENKKEILNAKQRVEALFSSSDPGQPIEEQLIKDYELLDGVDIYEYSQGRTGQEERKNLIREKLDQFQGETGKIYWLIGFVPESEKNLFLKKIAQKRLSWLALGEKSFSKWDTHLFNLVAKSLPRLKEQLTREQEKVLTEFFQDQRRKNGNGQRQRIFYTA